MESKTANTQIITKREKLSETVEQIIENDISLPDYCGDIVKILNCNSETNIFSQGMTGDKITVDGCVNIRLLYISDSGKLEIYECSYPFNRSVDVRNAEMTDIVSVKAVSEQINCRAVSPRRADVRGSVTLRITVYSLDVRELACQSDAKGIHCLKNSVNGNFLVASMEKSFTLSDSFDIQGGVKLSKVYRTSVMPVVNEIKTITGKMMIKGSVAVDITSLDNDGEFVTQRVNLPVSQITDMEGITDTSECMINLKRQSVDVIITADTPQAAGKFEVSLIMALSANAYCKDEITVMSEVYSPKCELVYDEFSFDNVSSMTKVNENYTVTSKMDFSSYKAEKIVDASVKQIKCTSHFEDNAVVCKGNINYNILLMTADSDSVFLERTADFEYRKQLDAMDEECIFEPSVYVNAMNKSLADASSLTVNTELHFDGVVYSVNRKKAIASVSEGEEYKHGDDAKMVIYFASKGEKLWDIAKFHGSSVENIKSVNSLAEDVLPEDKMLIFSLE